MKRIAQWSVYLTLTIVGLIAFLMLCGEETPGHPMRESAFYGIKLSAMTVLIVCYLVGRFLDRRGFLPELKKPEKENKQED